MDLGKIAFLLEHIRVQQPGVRILDGELLHRHLRRSRRNIRCLGSLDGLYFSAIEIVGETIVANVAASESIGLCEKVVQKD